MAPRPSTHYRAWTPSELATFHVVVEELGKDTKNRNTTFSGLSHGTAWDEHEDMGNVTPRILQCVQRLNSAMLANGTSGAFRRVHHNAESHRNHLFGAITGNEMVEGEGLPVTGFHPAPIAGFDSVVTITTFSDFKAYVQEVHAAGFYVPKNWTWNLSIRNRPGYIGRAV